jgi:hypothetical protein
MLYCGNKRCGAVMIAVPDKAPRVGQGAGARLEHDPEKWVPVFGKDHPPTIGWSGMTIRRKVIPL